ncbi:hypothetical protein VTI74DRAFT_938 [Chaetomium olivicolor]
MGVSSLDPDIPLHQRDDKIPKTPLPLLSARYADKMNCFLWSDLILRRFKRPSGERRQASPSDLNKTQEADCVETNRAWFPLRESLSARSADRRSPGGPHAYAGWCVPHTKIFFAHYSAKRSPPFGPAENFPAF